MNGFDLIILATLALFAAFGAWRGLLGEAVSLLTWVLAVALGWIFAAPVSRLFDDAVADEVLRQLLAFVAIFAAVFTLGAVAAFLLRKSFARRGTLRIANIALGGAVGAARGAVIIIAAFLVAGLTPIPERGWWRESAVAPVFEHMALYVARYIPRDIARHIRYG